MNGRAIGRQLGRMCYERKADERALAGLAVCARAGEERAGAAGLFGEENVVAGPALRGDEGLSGEPVVGRILRRVHMPHDALGRLVQRAYSLRPLEGDLGRAPVALHERVHPFFEDALELADNLRHVDGMR